jgi:hypothetical protein
MQTMKFLIVLSLMFCACSAQASGNAAGDLELRVELTTGERSRDSSSQTTTISIAPHVDAIVWEQTFSGRRRATPPLHREYKLSPANRQKLIALLESKSLLVTNSIELQEDYPPTHQYFIISVESALGGKNGAISITGPRTAVKVNDEKLYQDAIALVKELYRIINSQGGRVIFEELVVAKRTPPQGNHSPFTSKEIQ